jgi:hypothetical protein
MGGYTKDHRELFSSRSSDGMISESFKLESEREQTIWWQLESNLNQHFCLMLGNRTSSEPNYLGALPRDKPNGEEVKKLMDDD